MEGPQAVDGSAICNDKASCKTLAATDSSWGCAYSKCYRKHGWGQMFGSCEPDPLKAKVLNRTKSSWQWESGPPGCFGSWSDENTCRQNCNDENRACGTKCEMDLNGFGSYIWTLTIQAQPITQAAGVQVKQGTITGTLVTALTGNGMTTIVFATDTSTDPTTFEEIQPAFLTSTSIVIGDNTFKSSATNKDVKLSDTNCTAGECCCEKSTGDMNAVPNTATLVFTGTYATTATMCDANVCKIKFPTECPQNSEGWCYTNHNKIPASLGYHYIGSQKYYNTTTPSTVYSDYINTAKREDRYAFMQKCQNKCPSCAQNCPQQCYSNYKQVRTDILETFSDGCKGAYVCEDDNMPSNGRAVVSTWKNCVLPVPSNGVYDCKNYLDDDDNLINGGHCNQSKTHFLIVYFLIILFMVVFTDIYLFFHFFLQTISEM